MTLNGRLTLITTKDKYALLKANVSVQINYGKITLTSFFQDILCLLIPPSHSFLICGDRKGNVVMRVFRKQGSRNYCFLTKNSESEMKT